jgi:hypothetical protein
MTGIKMYSKLTIIRLCYNYVQNNISPIQYSKGPIIHILTGHIKNTFCMKNVVNVWAETLTRTNRDIRM